MKLKKPSKLPTGKSYHNNTLGYLDFDGGKIEFATDDYGAVVLSANQTKALFTSMLMHYMADGDTDLFE